MLRQIEASILTFPPERGGALLGPAGVPVITAYLDDPAAATTAASYLPSGGIAEQVRRCEVDTGLEFKGMVHSHPDGMNHPSGLDRQAVGHALADNPHLAVFACPIVTAIGPDPWRPLAGHEHELAGGRISWFAGRRRRGGATQLLRTPSWCCPSAATIGVDVHYAASAAVKLGLSLLLPEETTGSLCDLAARAAAEGQTYLLLLGMTPDYWVFPSVFRDVPGQHAFPSVWAAVQRDPACPVWATA